MMMISSNSSSSRIPQPREAAGALRREEHEGQAASREDAARLCSY